MKRVLFLSLLLLAAVAAGAQTYIGTMKVGGVTHKDVYVKLTVTGDTATVFVHNVFMDRLGHYKIDLTLPDIRLEEQPQRTTMVCYNIVPTSKGEPYPEYLIRRLHGSIAVGVLSFSCMLDETFVTFSGVINQRLR
ncbi:MAG: hypothetical protein IJ745_08640 [Bacteroidales bacterium]|nr:hypothetical protein [Bacteroidales bacterium]